MQIEKLGDAFWLHPESEGERKILFEMAQRKIMGSTIVRNDFGCIITPHSLKALRIITKEHKTI